MSACGGPGPHAAVSLTFVCPRRGCTHGETRCTDCGGFQEATRLMQAHVLSHDVATGADQCTGCAGNGAVCLHDCLVQNLARESRGPYPG